MKKTQPDEKPRGAVPSGQPLVHTEDTCEDLLKDEQKKRGQFPLHDEPIGGA